MSAESEALHFPSFEVRVETLPNGLEVLVREDPSAPVVSLQGWCRSGSIHEGDWLGAGVSHFLEHMLFKGAGRRDANEIAQTVQAQGGYINAYTSFDRTVYWIDAPSSGTMTCLEVLCDVIGDATLPEDEFENESDVIRREIAMGDDNPDQVLSKLFFRTAYAVHPCRYPVIGHLDLFNQLRREDLYTYYRERYSPDNLFLVVVGDVVAEEIIAKIGEKLGGLARRRRSPLILPSEPPQRGPRREEVAFPTELHRERLAWQIPDGLDPAVPAIDLLAGILGDGRSSRLFQSVREKQQLAHSIGAWAYTPSFTGQFGLSFDTEPDKAGAAREAVLREVARIREEGVSEGEVDKARRQILSAQFSTFTDMRGQASDIGSNWLLARHPDHTRDYVEAVQRVRCDAVREAAATYLRPDCITSVALLPKVAAKPPRSSAAKRSEDIRKIELANGLTVLILPDHRVPFVQASGVFRGGLLAETEGTAGMTRLMSRLLTKDTLKRSAEELALEIESVGGGMGASTGNNSFGVSFHALRPDLERVVDLLGETLLEPAFLGDREERLRQDGARIHPAVREIDRRGQEGGIIEEERGEGVGKTLVERGLPLARAGGGVRGERTCQGVAAGAQVEERVTELVDDHPRVRDERNRPIVAVGEEHEEVRPDGVGGVVRRCELEERRHGRVPREVHGEERVEILPARLQRVPRIREVRVEAPQQESVDIEGHRGAVGDDIAHVERRAPGVPVDVVDGHDAPAVAHLAERARDPPGIFQGGHDARRHAVAVVAAYVRRHGIRGVGRTGGEGEEQHDARL